MITLFPPPDHPHYRLLRQLAEERDQQAEELAEAGEGQPVETWCTQHEVDFRSLLALTEERTKAIAHEFTIKPRVTGSLPEFDMTMGLLMAMADDFFAAGYEFALNRPDLP